MSVVSALKLFLEKKNINTLEIIKTINLLYALFVMFNSKLELQCMFINKGIIRRDHSNVMIVI